MSKKNSRRPLRFQPSPPDKPSSPPSSPHLPTSGSFLIHQARAPSVISWWQAEATMVFTPKRCRRATGLVRVGMQLDIGEIGTTTQQQVHLRRQMTKVFSLYNVRSDSLYSHRWFPMRRFLGSTNSGHSSHWIMDRMNLRGYVAIRSIGSHN